MLKVWLCAFSIIAWSASAAATEYRYTLALDADLNFLDVQVNISSASHSTWHLSARDGHAADISRFAQCDGREIALKVRGNRMTVPADLHCVTLRVDLNAARTSGRIAALQQARTLVVSPARFMWLPSDYTDIEAQFVKTLPGVDGLSPKNKSTRGTAGGNLPGISVPWLWLTDQTYRIPNSPRSSSSMAVFGDFTPIRLPHLRRPAAFMGEALHAAKLKSWLTPHVQNIAELASGFPNPNLQVLIFAVPNRGNSPVPFGHVIRDQGETVAFYVEEGRALEDFQKDWTAAHEFSHVLLPYIRGSQKWISEGFASYYQNVLQARAGHYGPQEAWLRMHRSFASAASKSGSLSPNDTANADFWNARMLIYWSGAAMALHADVALRSKPNPTTLDQLLSRLRTCCLPSPRVWRGRDFFSQLDDLGGDGIMLGIYDKYANRVGMPDTRALFSALGIGPDGRVESETAPLAGIRRDIMSAEDARY